VFEILHGGHIRLLEFAASLGRVVVALNSDASAWSVKARKPIVNENDRMHLIRSISWVDEVVLMDDMTAKRMIKQTNAKYVVKSGPPENEEVVRLRDDVPEDVEVKMFPVDESYSSKRLREALGV
jgi:cytidyltransferase-like protein